MATFIDTKTNREIETSDAKIFDKVNAKVGYVRFVEKKADKGPEKADNSEEKGVSVEEDKPEKKRGKTRAEKS